MRLDTEMRIQGIMMASTAIGMVASLGLILAGLIYNAISYLLVAGGLLAITYGIMHFGLPWTQRTLARVEKIRVGGGDKDDLEWIKPRKQK